MAFISSLDVKIFYLIQHLGQHYPFLTQAAIFAANNLIYLLPLHLTVLWLWGDICKRKNALTIFIAVILGIVASFFIGMIYDRPRPFVAGIAKAFLTHKPTPSFPSDHALIFSAYLYCLYVFRDRIMFFIVLIFALLTCWARVYGGIHYPFDILGGAVLGCLTAFVAIRYIIPFAPNFILSIPPVKQKKN